MISLIIGSIVLLCLLAGAVTILIAAVGWREVVFVITSVLVTVVMFGLSVALIAHGFGEVFE